jgi:protein-tyrosine-phosphatase
MPVVLFVCEGNIFRSQMAEGFFNASAPDGWQAKSAGTRPGASVHTRAIALMNEVGIDISRQRTKPFDPPNAASAWRVVVMCNLDACPAELIQRAERWSIIDPAALPKKRWREIRDEIARRVNVLLDEIRRL